MNKEREKGQRLVKALNAQANYFYGEPGSVSRAALEMQSTLSMPDMQFTHDEMLIKGTSPDPAEIESQMREAYRRSFLRALQDPNPDFLSQIIGISKALKKKDSSFFQKIANGLNELEKLRGDLFSLDLMDGVRKAFFEWMCPGFSIYDWTLLPYKTFVEKQIEPTKQQIRELAMRHWAMMSLFRKKDISLMNCHLQVEQPPEVERLIKERIKELPEQKWSRFWEKAELTHLKSGRPGRPKITSK